MVNAIPSPKLYNVRAGVLRHGYLVCSQSMAALLASKVDVAMEYLKKYACHLYMLTHGRAGRPQP
jgi:hypothetical protein